MKRDSAVFFSLSFLPFSGKPNVRPPRSMKSLLPCSRYLYLLVFRDRRRDVAALNHLFPPLADDFRCLSFSHGRTNDSTVSNEDGLPMR